MADIGLKYMAAAKMASEPDNSAPTYDTGFVVGKMVQINLSVKNAEGKLYADDELAEYVSEFSEADLTADVDNIPLDKQATIYGAKYEDDELQHSQDDDAPQLGMGGVQPLRVGGVKKFRTWFFTKVRAALPDWKGNTRGDSVSFGTQPIKAKITSPNYGPWYRVKEFATEAAAKAHIDTLLSVGTWHKIAVLVSGADTGESATPVGTSAVAAGGTFVLNITGNPVKLYDNGVDCLTDVADGKYTLTSIDAAHNIAVIF